MAIRPLHLKLLPPLSHLFTSDSLRDPVPCDVPENSLDVFSPPSPLKVQLVPAGTGSLGIALQVKLFLLLWPLSQSSGLAPRPWVAAVTVARLPAVLRRQAPFGRLLP
jgi:hypothetical protein